MILQHGNLIRLGKCFDIFNMLENGNFWDFFGHF